MEITGADFVDDDTAEVDRNIQMPLESDYRAGTENRIDYGAFSDAQNAYQLKQARDNLRTQLKEQKLIDGVELFDFLATKDGESYNTLFKYDFSSGKVLEEKLDGDMEGAEFRESVTLSGDNAGFYYF